MPYFSLRQTLNLARSFLLKTSPTYVQYYLTARCNLACEQCNIVHAQADAEEMRLEQIEAMAANLRRIGVAVVLLIGGEPFMRRDLPEIARAFSREGIHVRLQTNGFASREKLAACYAAGAHDISISLDSLAPDTQDVINGQRRHSWERALRTVSLVNELSPPNATAFFGTVIMPRNLGHLPDVLEFADAIGWGVSLVPAHHAPPESPRGFRMFAGDAPLAFPPALFPVVEEVLGRLRDMKRDGFPLYDSDLYLDDIVRFLTGRPLTWRDRSGGVCDSPNAYFAIEPDGSISPCCDYKLDRSYPAYHPDFPRWFRSGEIHERVFAFTRACSGCMYGSYPEITVTLRSLRDIAARFLYFNGRRKPLVPSSPEELLALARRIREKNSAFRERVDRLVAKACPLEAA